MKNKLNRKVLGVIILLGFLFLLVTPVLAADGIVPCGLTGIFTERCTLCDLIKGFKILFDYGIKIIAVITLACATFAGVMYIVSSGNEGTMESAKKFLSASLIGFAVVLGAWVMVNTTITVLMPTKKAADTGGILGIGKSWVDFGSVDCSSSTTDGGSIEITTSNTKTTSITAKAGESFTLEGAFSVKGGSGNYTWSATGLPEGLKIDSATGTISGTPTTAGTYIVTVTATDLGAKSVSANNSASITLGASMAFAAEGDSASTQFELVVAADSTNNFTIATASPLPSATVGSAYNISLSATGGSGNYVWSVLELPGCVFPAGLTVGADGKISGTPTTAGTYSHVCTKVYSGGDTRFKDFELVIAAAGTGDFTIATLSPLPSGTVNVSYPAKTLSATGGSGSYSWSFFAGSNCDNSHGLSISSAGVISGIPTKAGTYNTCIKVSSGSDNISKAFELVIIAETSICELTITSSSLSEGTVGSAYSESLSATGEGGTYRWSALSLPGCVFPPGLAVSSDGIISGTPTKAGVYDKVCVRLSSGGCYNTSKAFVLAVKDSSGGFEGECYPVGTERTYEVPCVGHRNGNDTFKEICDSRYHWGERMWVSDNCDTCIDGYHPYYTAAGMICRPN